MRPPEQIAADLDDLAEALDEQGMPQSAEKCREAAEALRHKAYASRFDRTNELFQAKKAQREAECACHDVHAYAESVEAERDALIAYLTAWYAAYPEDSMWEALPEPLQQRIETKP